MARTALLSCGILAAIVYITADTLGALTFAGYRYTDQTISELSAIGATSRGLMVPLMLLYAVLVALFGVGVRQAAGRNRALQIAAALFVGFGIVCLTGPFTPMHLRGAAPTLTDSLHIAGAIVNVLFILLILGFAASAFGRGYRRYSLATAVVVLGFGALAGTYGPNIEANLPTPWVGIIERICVFAFLVWTATLAAGLLIDGRTAAAASQSAPRISGDVARGFETVRDTFAENFARRRELGGGCCAYYHGEKVVDLWGGIRDLETGAPWERDTMVIVHSATKGFAAMTLAVAHSRGWLDYEERVAAYWPEFAQHGKDRMTVRQLLAHQGGLFAFDEPVDRVLVADLDRLAVVLARQKPAWAPGSRQAYHALTLGFYQNELLRRVDPRHRSLGQFFQDEIATPLGLDLYIRLPESVPNSRLARMTPPFWLDMVRDFPIRLTIDGFNKRSNIHRALIANPGTGICLDQRRIYSRNVEVPSGGAVGTAQAIARLYSVFATGGRELGLTQETLDLLAAPAVPSAHGFYDECLRGDVQFSLGFMKPAPSWPFGGPRSFGSPGAGGAMGFADPDARIGYGYVTSQMGTQLTGDPRDTALRTALYAALPSRSEHRSEAA